MFALSLIVRVNIVIEVMFALPLIVYYSIYPNNKR